MEQQTNMVTEVNKIIANILVINREITLPEIGSLYVESRPAKLDSAGKNLAAPRNIVQFSEQSRGLSLVDVIAQRAKCTTEQAGEIYSRWNQRVNVDSVVNIEGVGAISGKSFSVDNNFDLMLNPEVVRSLVMKRRSNTMVWILTTAAAVLIVGLGTYILSSGYGAVERVEPEREVAVVPTPVEEVETPTPQEEDSVVVEEVVTPPAPSVEKVMVEKPAVEKPKPIVLTTNPRYRVVYGIFSVKANTDNAIQKAKRLKGDVVCTVRNFGENYMVSIFESDNIAECKAFITENETIFPGVWISKRKGE